MILSPKDFVEEHDSVTINDEEGSNKLHTSLCSLQFPDRLFMAEKMVSRFDSRLIDSFD